MITIIEPADGATVQVSGAMGYVSASCTARLSTGETASEVYAKLNASSSDTEPPADATQMSGGSGGTWSGEVPSAACDSSGVDNTLYVWATYAAQTDWERATVTFKGQC